MELRDSRRLTGPNLLQRLPGAVIDVALDPGEDADAAVAAWRRWAGRILAAVGWGREVVSHRVFHGGVSLAFSAPIDALHAATEVAQWAWQAAVAALRGDPEPDLDAAAARLRSSIAAERKPPVVALQRAARERRVAFLWDDATVTVGMGVGSRSWPASEVPDPSAVDWSGVHDVPSALVAGTDGKTATVRLLAAMARTAGLTPGISTPDGCWVGEEKIGDGDDSGPVGARQVLRDRRVEVVILETARGGMLRRGLALEHAGVALVTHVADDHPGEWGVRDPAELVEAELVVEKGTRRLVLNADDPHLRTRPDRAGVRRIWYSLEHDPCVVAAHVATGGETCVLDGDRMVLHTADGAETVAHLGDLPPTPGGADRHHVANALGAICVARQLRLPLAAIRAGLRGS
jgi:hypothetical protein